MAITATYISSTSFSVATDLRSYFIPGRALKMDCGADGIKFGFVDYSAYTSVTTINLLSSESQAITANLASVEISSVKPGSSNTGCTALESILMLRGFKAGMVLSYKDADEFYIDAGSIHIDDGTYDRIYTVPSQLTKSVTGLSNSTWYHIYANPPANGLVLTAAEITYSTTAPSVDTTKGGKLYHATDGTKRCIGWVYSNASSNIAEFKISDKHYTLETRLAVWSSQTINSTGSTATVSVPIDGLLVRFAYTMWYLSGTTAIALYGDGSSEKYLSAIGYTQSSYQAVLVPTHMLQLSAKTVKAKTIEGTSMTFSLLVCGFVIPSSL